MEIVVTFKDFDEMEKFCAQFQGSHPEGRPKAPVKKLETPEKKPEKKLETPEKKLETPEKKQDTAKTRETLRRLLVSANKATGRNVANELIQEVAGVGKLVDVPDDLLEALLEKVKGVDVNA